jgi:phosphatidylglycerophosphate synthase
MLDLALRQVKERALEGPARAVARVVGPNALTLASAVLCVGAGVLAWRGDRWLAVAAWLVGRLFDGLDGPVARIRGSASDFGGYFDIIGDHLGYAFIPLGLAAGIDEYGTWVAFGALMAAFFVNSISWTFLAAILEKRGAGAAARGEMTTITMPFALIEGTETIVLFTAFLAVPSLAAELFALMAALVAVTVVQRLVWARRHL